MTTNEDRTTSLLEVYYMGRVAWLLVKINRMISEIHCNFMSNYLTTGKLDFYNWLTEWLIWVAPRSVKYKGQSVWLLTMSSLVRFPKLSQFLMWIGSGTGSTKPREDNRVATWLRSRIWLIKSKLIDLTECNVNHIIPSCSRLPVSCRSLVDRCDFLTNNKYTNTNWLYDEIE